MSDKARDGRRFGVELPNGERVTVTVTADILAVAKRVTEALASGVEPSPADIATLMQFASEDT